MTQTDWLEEPAGFSGLNFGTALADVERRYLLKAPPEYQLRSQRLREGHLNSQGIMVPSADTKTVLTQLDFWGTSRPASLTFIAGRLVAIHLAYPTADYLTVKSRLVTLFGQPKNICHEGNAIGTGVRSEHLLWFGREVVAWLLSEDPSEIRVDDRNRPYDAGDLFLATHEYMKGTLYGELMRKPPIFRQSGAAAGDMPSARVLTTFTSQFVSSPSIPTTSIAVDTTPTALTFRLNDGRTISYARHSLDIGTLRVSHMRLGETYKYEYIYDNRRVHSFSVGRIIEGSHLAFRTIWETPKGWHARESTAFAMGGPFGEQTERIENAKYTMVSDYLPGLAEAVFVGDERLTEDAEVPFNIDNQSMQFILATRANDSKIRRFVIGPSIRPSCTRRMVMNEIETWIRWGFVFLKPLFDLGPGEDPKPVLQGLSPSTQLERDVVLCLQAVL
jgi:hypothetical protein